MSENFYGIFSAISPVHNSFINERLLAKIDGDFMRKNKTFAAWYELKKSELNRALDLMLRYEKDIKLLYTKKLACKNYEQACFFKRDIEASIASRCAYERISGHIKQTLLDALNIHYARIIARSLKLEDREIGCQRKDYIAVAFINRDKQIKEIYEMFGED